MVSATPSGGWLQSCPVIPGLGFSLNSRGQMFWLEEGLPSSLAPGKRPRTTLTPSLALRDGQPTSPSAPPAATSRTSGTPFFLRHVHHGLNLQEAIDLPLFHSEHAPLSFRPRPAKAGHMQLEATFPSTTIAAFEAPRPPPHRPARLVDRAAMRCGRDGEILKAAATPRLMQAYAVGR